MNDNFDINKLEGVGHGQAIVLLHSMLPALRCAKAHLDQKMGSKREEEIIGMNYWIQEIQQVLDRVK